MGCKLKSLLRGISSIVLVGVGTVEVGGLKPLRRRLTWVLFESRLGVASYLFLRQQDYRDHRDKIFSKFVSMIEELVEARSSSLKLTDWDAPGSSGGGGEVGDDGGSGVAGGGGGGGTGGAGAGDPCQFTADLRRGVTAMHNVLQQQLPSDQLQVRRFWPVMNRSFQCTRRIFFPGDVPSSKRRTRYWHV